METKYPEVAAVIVRWLFMPYIAFLTTFMYYALFHFEGAEDHFNATGKYGTFYLIEGQLIRLALIGLVVYFIQNEIVQYK